jgi:hypothetical protein
MKKNFSFFKEILYYNDYQDPSKSPSKRSPMFSWTTKEHWKNLVIRTTQINDKSQIKKEQNAKYSPMSKKVGK